ncbi:MAG: DUF6263 family protein [Isosphaeraceae bacterium]
MPRVLITSFALAVALVSTAGAQVKLEVKHAEKTSWSYQNTVKLHQVLTFMGVDIETRSEEATTTGHNVGERRPDGSLPIVNSIDAVRAKIELPGNLKVMFDSAEPEANKPKEPALLTLWTLLRSLSGVKYTLVLDRDGKVSAVEGTESILDNAGDLDQATRDDVKARFTPDRLKQAAQEEFRLFPEILVREGDHWENTEVMPISGGQTLTFTRRYEYLGTVKEGGQTLDKIRDQATAVLYAMEPNPASPIKVTKSDLAVESSEGVILFDREAGRIIHRHDKTRIKGEMTLEIGNAEQPAKLDLSIEVDQRLKTP